MSLVGQSPRQILHVSTSPSKVNSSPLLEDIFLLAAKDIWLGALELALDVYTERAEAHLEQVTEFAVAALNRLEGWSPCRSGTRGIWILKTRLI